MGIGIGGSDLIRKEGCTGSGTGVGKNVSGFDVITAEVTGSGKITFDKRNVIVVPERSHYIVIKMKRHFAVFYIENCTSELTGTDQNIICHGIAAKKSFSVTDGWCLRIGPAVIKCGRGDKSFDGLQIGIGSTGGFGERLPVGIV